MDKGKLSGNVDFHVLSDLLGAFRLFGFFLLAVYLSLKSIVGAVSGLSLITGDDDHF